MTFRTSFHDRPVLVTGGCGFLGRALVARLRAGGARVRVLDDCSATGGVCLLEPDAGTIFRRGSVTDEQAVREIAEGVELVIHLASVVGMRSVHKDPERAFQVSDRGTATVLAATGDAHAVLVSSSCVYGLRAAEPAREFEAPTESACLAYDGGRRGYACGKLRLEQHGAAARREGRPVLILRPFNVVGPGQDPEQGMVIPTFVRSALRGEPLRIFGDGNQTRCFSGIDYFVERVLALLALPEAWTAEDATYNIGSTEATSIGELARLVIEAAGSPSTVEHVPFEQAYPGRRDVLHRKPSEAALDRILGPPSWPPIETIVTQVVAKAARAVSETGAKDARGDIAANGR